MRTSLNKIKLIEAYLENDLSVGQRLLFQAKMIVDRQLRKEVCLQRNALELARIHFLKNQFKEFHQLEWNDPMKVNFRNEVLNLFNPKRHDSI